jgi:purine-binding chemotaxis protein CheW
MRKDGLTPVPDRNSIPPRIPVHTPEKHHQKLAPERHRGLLVFHLAGQIAAFPRESVERVTPMAELAHPPGLPSVLEGVLNLSGTAVPVLRIDRLLQLPPQHPGLYSMLIILRDASENRIAVLADRVSGILTVPAEELLPIGKEGSFNGCSEATVRAGEEIIHVLSPDQILLQKEREALSQFQKLAQLRLQAWEAART